MPINYVQNALAGFQAGQQMTRDMQTRQAMSALAQNPNDPRAMQMLAQADPQDAIQIQQQQAQATQAQHDQWVKILGNAAAQADTPEKWDQIVDYFAQNGHPEAEQFRGKFSPAARAALMAQAGIAADKPQGTALQQNYQFLQGVDPHLAQHYLQNQAEGPPMIASNGDGTFTIIPRNMVGGGQPAPSAAPPAAVAYLKAHPEMRAQFDEKYGPGAADQALGGTGGNVGGGFPQ